MLSPVAGLRVPPHTHKHSYARTILHFRNPRQYTITVANTKVDAGDGDRTGDLRRASLERYHCASLTRLGKSVWTLYGIILQLYLTCSIQKNILQKKQYSVCSERKCGEWNVTFCAEEIFSMGTLRNCLSFQYKMNLLCTE